MSLIIFFELIIVVGGWKYKPQLVQSFSSLGVDLSVSNTHAIGLVLYTDYIHLFQLSGMILLVAMIGEIVLTFKDTAGNEGSTEHSFNVSNYGLVKSNFAVAEGDVDKSTPGWLVNTTQISSGHGVGNIH